jgi:hypothetical protein
MTDKQKSQAGVRLRALGAPAAHDLLAAGRSAARLIAALSLSGGAGRTCDM